MLLKYAISNFRSLKERQEISMIASSLRDDASGLINDEVLPVAVIYGANASGKSNIVNAFRFLQSTVLHSHNRADPDGGVSRTCFKLDPVCDTLPTSCDIDFVVDEVRYNFGFEATDKEFAKEWLYAFPRGTRRRLYLRKGQSIEFGRSLRGKNSIIADLMRPNSLYFSTAVQNDHEQITALAAFFRNIVAHTNLRDDSSYGLQKVFPDGIDERVIKMLDEAGAGVIGSRIETTEETELELAMRRGIVDLIERHVGTRPEIIESSSPRQSIMLGHRGKGGQAFFLPMREESEGTRRLLRLLGPIFKALDTGSLIIVDELDASLHTKACEALVRQFTSKQTNPKGAQLVATTHDTNLLGGNYLRRDQIWFARKDSEGATMIYPLTDVKVRKGDNLERGYLEGRFGAVPDVSDW